MVCFGNINSSQFNSALAPLLLLLLRRQAH
jgi:hypothetical protein